MPSSGNDRSFIGERVITSWHLSVRLIVMMDDITMYTCAKKRKVILIYIYIYALKLFIEVFQ